MKNISRLILVMSSVFATIACSKEGARLFEGDWSFKTSGTVTYLIPAGQEDGQCDTVTAKIRTEAGQMHIVRVEEDDMLVTLNALGGDVTVFEASASGGRIDLKPAPLAVDVEGVLPLSAEVTAGGSGERHDDIIVFRMTYSGHVDAGEEEYEIIGSSINCVATLN